MTTPVDTSNVDAIIGKILGGMSVDGGKRCMYGGEVVESVEAGKKKGHRHRSRRRYARGGEVELPLLAGKLHHMGGGEATEVPAVPEMPAPEGGKRHKHHKGSKRSHTQTPSVAARVRKAMSGGEAEPAVEGGDVDGGRSYRGMHVRTLKNGAQAVVLPNGQLRFIKGASPSYMRKIRRSR
jgi:hypothetical protein